MYVTLKTINPLPHLNLVLKDTQQLKADSLTESIFGKVLVLYIKLDTLNYKGGLYIAFREAAP